MVVMGMVAVMTRQVHHLAPLAALHRRRGRLPVAQRRRRRGVIREDVVFLSYGSGPLKHCPVTVVLLMLNADAADATEAAATAAAAPAGEKAPGEAA